MECGPAACGCCGHGLAGVPAAWLQKRQVFEAAPPPPPVVTEYQILARQCPACGETSVGLAPAGVTGRVQYGPRVHASTALAVCANYLPVARAAKLVAALTGVSVSAGFTASIRGKAAARLGPFMDRVRVLLHAAGVLYADETPARAAGHLHYVHVACTGFLTAMHTGDRTKEAIDAGGVLPGYAGTIVRDGYKGYEHLTDALHAWCGAHGLRDLAGLYRFDPDGQVWARAMAGPLIDANAAATAARSSGQARLDEAQLAAIRARYRGAVAMGITGNQRKRTQTGKDGLRLARRFRDLRGHDPAVRHRPGRRVHLESGRTGRPPGQGADADLRRLLAHPGRPGRLRHRPVLPVHRRQMGHRRTRRPHPALHRPALAPARNRAPVTTAGTRVIPLGTIPATRTPTRDEQAPTSRLPKPAALPACRHSG